MAKKYKISTFGLLVFIPVFVFSILIIPHKIKAGLLLNRTLYIGMSAGLVGHWTFDGVDLADVTAYDRSGTAKGTITGGATSTPGRIGQALSFDGVNDYVDIGAGPTTVNSVSFWVYPKTTTGYFVNLTGTTDYIWVSAGTVTATGFTAPAIYVNGVQSSTLVVHQWQHVVVTDTTAENASNLDIGRTQDTNYMEGMIDDVRISNRVLTQEEIKRLYKMGGTLKIGQTISNDSLRSGLVGHWTFDGVDMAGVRASDISGSRNNGQLSTTTIIITFSATASTTWIAPFGITAFSVEAWGAGGAGGGQAINQDGGGGGGGGAYSRTTYLPLVSDTYNVSIGDGGNGSAGVDGTSGGDSYFANGNGNTKANRLVVACGGLPGLTSSGTPPAGPAGGAASCGLGGNTFSGGAGGKGRNQTAGKGGGGGEGACTNQDGDAGTDGGTSPGAGGALGADGNGCDGGNGGAGAAEDTAGNPGTAPGGGGGGSGSDEAGVDLAGGAGADGQIRITYDIPGPTRTPGRIGQALSFDGVNDYVDIGAGPTTVNSVSFWVYPKTTTGYFVNLTGTTDYIWVSAGTVTATGFTAPAIYVNGVQSSTLVVHQWQHVVVTDTTAENASNLDIGRTQDTNYMEGMIDDVRISNRVLTQEEIKRLYTMGR